MFSISSIILALIVIIASSNVFIAWFYDEDLSNHATYDKTSDILQMLKVMLIYTSMLLDLYKWSILIVATKEYNIISTASFK